MAMFAPIPLPGIDNDQFKDVMDYFDQLMARKAKQQQFTQEQERLKRQFGETKSLEQKKLDELSKYHQGLLDKDKDLKPLQMKALEAKIESYKNKPAQETPEQKQAREVATAKQKEGNKEGFKIKNSARALHSSLSIIDQLDKLLAENPGLTGIKPGLAVKTNLSQNPALGKFVTLTGKLQAEIGKYASQRGGIQTVKWAEKVKPSEWKDLNFNKGMLEAARENILNDYNQLGDEYKDATGEELFPVQSKPKINKEHVNEENILYTMKVTGLPREEVIARLKKKGLL